MGCWFRLQYSLFQDGVRFPVCGGIIRYEECDSVVMRVSMSVCQTVTSFLVLLLTTVPGSLTSSEAPPVPGECLPSVFRDGADHSLHLLCHLSAINSQAEKTNFSMVPAQHTASLTVRCTDKISVSYLEPRGFRSLVWLEELSIEDCNLETIPDRAFQGLTKLRSLSIRSSSSGVVSVSRGSFEGLANLHSLDLSENKVRLTESGVLCSMPSLVYLNLSNTDLGSVANLGLTTVLSQAKCLRYLRTLDLSHNRLTSISSQDMLNFPSIEKVDLSFNFIRSLDNDSFEFNKDLSDLDISNNHLSHLHSQLFTKSRLSHLSVANNSLTSVPSEVFSQQENLQYLDLSGNLLESSELKPTLFAGCPNLVELYLHNNRYVPAMQSTKISSLEKNTKRLQVIIKPTHTTLCSENIVTFLFYPTRFAYYNIFRRNYP